MKLLRLMAVGIALVAGMGIAAAQQPPIPSVPGPQDPGKMNATFNTLINQINAILLPMQPNVNNAVNFISLTPSVTGSNAVIGLAPGADANAGITINPNGGGNIVLFGDGDTGTIKFGNTTAFTKATGLAPCPGAVPNMPLGVGKTVTGYLVVQDWTGTKYGVPSCRQTPNG